MMRRILATVLFVLLAFLAAESTVAQSSDGGGTTIVCRAMEAYSDPDTKTVVVIFHQRDENERAELATLLRDRSGQKIELQDAYGKWIAARLFRLKSCFGRGMLLLPASIKLAENQEFILRVPKVAAP